MAISADAHEFVRLCIPLTGFAEFDLYGTGMAQLYLDTARAQVGEKHFAEFLEAWKAAYEAGAGVELLTPTQLEIARAVTYLWYSGAWPRLAPAAHADLRREQANAEFVVAPGAYVEGLVWRTFHGHPAGAKPPGFGTWGVRPPRPSTLAELRAEIGIPEPGEGAVPAGEETLVAVPPDKLPGPLLARGTAPSAVATADTVQGTVRQDAQGGGT
ncbi:hypothetical protein BJF79_18290 [Actinomadura sp. CNU-125]|uniref:hypothetical protein n=1 Tax=Actinomadura sp. CNU-125 TaxID=1904961 RepID=UPI000959CEC3|nr:hypothetical protein [Actinomadura sp. CNU-125]OLT16570.1 hypothetical protein BJF79_18290 [Actinomadura sp. CNU-125]